MFKKLKLHPVTWLFVAIWVVLTAALIQLVFLAKDNQSELVRKDYYDTGLRQDQLLKQTQNAKSWEMNLEIVSRAPLALRLKTKDGYWTGPLSVRLYRPNSSEMDRSFNYTKSDTGDLYVADWAMAKGQWKILIVAAKGADTARLSMSDNAP